jgi:hypothetical protein
MLFSFTSVPYVLAVGTAALAYLTAGFLSRGSPG